MRNFSEKHKIFGIDNFDPFYSRQIKVRNLKDSGIGTAFLELDILDLEKMTALFLEFKPDLVIHIAAKAGVRPSIENPLEYARVNVEGTVSVYEACRAAGTSAVLLASSSSVYGSRCKVPFSESDPINSPQSPYAASKISAEFIAGTYSRLYGIKTAALRFFTVYGPGQRPDLAIAKFTRSILENRSIPVYGDGSTQRDYTYITDILDGVRKAAEWIVNQPEGMYDVFNLGESKTTRLDDLIRVLEKNLAKSALIDRQPLQAGDVPLTCADISKAKNILGYYPEVDLDQGIEKYITWVKNTL